MGIFDKIKQAIFGHEAHAAPMPQTSAAEPAVRRTSTSAPLNPAPSSTPASPSAAPTGVNSTATPSPSPAAAPAPMPQAPNVAPASVSAGTSPGTSSGTSSGAANSGPVDIEPILDAAVKKKGQHLDWRKSIVDLMKALDLDSSLEARKELAHELHYTGNTDDSATMNVWLHKALMKKLAENGGKVPAELTD